MSVNWGVTSSSSEIFTVSVGDVLACLWVSKSLGKSEVNHIYVVLFLANSNEEVVWFDVSVQKVARVHKLDSLQLFNAYMSFNQIRVTKFYLPFDLQASRLSWGRTSSYSSWIDPQDLGQGGRWPLHCSHLPLQTSAHLGFQLKTYKSGLVHYLKSHLITIKLLPHLAISSLLSMCSQLVLLRHHLFQLDQRSTTSLYSAISLRQ